jgi:hypothetical protein
MIAIPVVILMGAPHRPPGQGYSGPGRRRSRPAGLAHPRQVTCAGSVVTRSLAGIWSIVRPQHGISGLSGDGLRCVTPSRAEPPGAWAPVCVASLS